MAQATQGNGNSSLPKEAFTTQETSLAQVKFLRRLTALPDGRYTIVITIEDGNPSDWTLMGSGNVERPA